VDKDKTIIVNKTIKLANNSLNINPDETYQMYRNAGMTSMFGQEFRKSSDVPAELRNVLSVDITSINIGEDGYVYVTHNGPWEIYTDTGFEKAISELVGFPVIWTEQGMQEDGMASLEASGSNTSIRS